MIEAYEKCNASVVCMEKVPARDTHLYGIMGGTMADKNTMRISAFVEKPAQGKRPHHTPRSAGMLLLRI